MLAQMSGPLLGIRVSAKEVSNALHTIVPAAKAFLSRPLGDRKWMYLYVDGTNFRVRRTTVDVEPTLVVLGVDETGRKSVLSMVQGDKDSRTAWDAVFVDLKERGLDGSCVLAGIIDGLPGLGDAFREAFSNAKVLRCWVHKARNVMPLVPRRYQAAFQVAFQVAWYAVAYADSLEAARAAFVDLKAAWSNDAAMQVVSPNGLTPLLAFTAIRLEYGWAQTPITSNKLRGLKWRELRERQLEGLTKSLLNQEPCMGRCCRTQETLHDPPSSSMPSGIASTNGLFGNPVAKTTWSSTVRYSAMRIDGGKREFALDAISESQARHLRPRTFGLPLLSASSLHQASAALRPPFEPPARGVMFPCRVPDVTKAYRQAGPASGEDSAAPSPATGPSRGAGSASPAASGLASGAASDEKLVQAADPNNTATVSGSTSMQHLANDRRPMVTAEQRGGACPGHWGRQR